MDGRFDDAIGDSTKPVFPIGTENALQSLVSSTVVANMTVDR